MYSATSVGSYVTGERSVWLTPRPVVAATKRAVIVHGGGGQTALGNMPPGNFNLELAEMGMSVAWGDMAGGWTWGNTTGQQRVTDLWDWLLADISPSPRTDKPLLFGTSMGGLVMLNWARANPTLVAGLYLQIPAVNPADIHDNNRGGYASSIETAYGGSGSYAANVGGFNPSAHASDYTSIASNMLIHYSGDDPICVPSEVTAFASATGATAVNIGNAGHGVSTLTPAQVQQVRQFYLDRIS